jgi:hypothetical protein
MRIHIAEMGFELPFLAIMLAYERDGDVKCGVGLGNQALVLFLKPSFFNFSGQKGFK